MVIEAQRSLTEVDITSPEFKANPFDFYARLREESPIFETRAGKLPVSIVTRYEDVRHVLTDERFAKNQRNVPGAVGVDFKWMPDFVKALQNNMLDMDVPDHTRLRNLVHKAFTPRHIERMATRVEELSNEYIDKAQTRGEMDLVADYALPIPSTIIAEILGIPQEDKQKFNKWSQRFTATQFGSILSLFQLLPAMWQFIRYIRRQLEIRCESPADDLLTALVEAETKGEKLSADEVVAMVVLLLIAGHETTVNLIASGTLALLEHPDQLAQLSENPDLIKPAVEELLRFVVPVETATERYAREDVVLQGKVIPQGRLTLAAIASANRDEAVFENPNILDITRSPNRHLSFGHGIHYCLGAPLARLEGSIALNTLVQRLPNLRLAVDSSQLQWRKAMILRGLESLPVKV